MNTLPLASVSRPLLRVLARGAFLASLLGLVPAAHAQPENLIPEGDFQADHNGLASAWFADDPALPWMRERFKVETEGRRTFIRSVQPPTVLSVTRRIDPSWKELELRFETRRLNVYEGEHQWDVAFAEIDFLNVEGQSLLEWDKVNWLPGDQPMWREIIRRYPVPPGAKTLVVRVANKAPGGTIDFSNIAVFVTKRADR